MSLWAVRMVGMSFARITLDVRAVAKNTSIVRTHRGYPGTNGPIEP